METVKSSSVHSNLKRQLRDRKEKKQYTEDWSVADEDLDGRRSFNIQDKIHSDKYTQCYVREMQGTDLTVSYFQRHGFNTPLLFKDKAGLGLHVPSTNFSINDVRTCVGSRRMLDVIDVSTHKSFEMSMKEWQRYYEDPSKEKLLNVISLEFSHTKLENYIQTPSIVRQLDWVDCVWPRHLKEAQTESTNVLDEMMYPKVQKYCLMSVEGCYTDFHIDFGGTSVWYHILRGGKVFWLIPPTEHNIKLYEQWVLSGKQSDIFFGDTVEKCSRITLHEGNTFFIPTGWIHAVFTPKDSLVFGGNFLHSYGIDKQVRVANVEEITHVPNKYRYPFFTEMLWYVLVRFVEILLGRAHLREGSYVEYHDPSKHIHLTPLELHGIKAIVAYLHSLPTNKKNIPDLIIDPVDLIKDIRNLVDRHRLDLQEFSVTGVPVLFNPTYKYGERRLMLPRPNIGFCSSSKMKPRMGGGKMMGGSMKSKIKAGPRRRRTRCKKCAACQQNDCGECAFCQDMVKFGGPGRAKQTCIMRQCLQPMLPVTAACAVCGLDGWGQPLVIPVHKAAKDAPSTLMECSVCYEIIHPECVEKQCPDHKGMYNEDLPNSWECPKCVRDGKNNDYRPRHFRARQKWDQRRKSGASEPTAHGFKQDPEQSDSEVNSDSSHEESQPPVKLFKVEEDENSSGKWSDKQTEESVIKRRNSADSDLSLTDTNSQS